MLAKGSKGSSRYPDIFAGKVVVCDGAMGTMLQAAGVSLDVSLPELNLTRSELVKAIHGAYISAGADVIETNTFGACRTRLRRYGLEDRVVEINSAAVRIAQAAAAVAPRTVLVAGSVAPARPVNSRGPVSTEALQEAFSEQIGALVKAGVDLIILETFGNLDELTRAINVAQQIDSALPLVAQMTFLDDGLTLAGETPAEVADRVDGLGVAALGVNCTRGPQGLLDILLELGKHSSLPLSAQPNAGSPTFVNGRFQYATNPAYLARYAGRYVEAGAMLVGGCCGTTPAHIEAVAEAVKGMSPVPHRSVNFRAQHERESAPDPSAPASKLVERLATSEFTVLAELGPPPGGSVDEAVQAAEVLHREGVAAVIVGQPTTARAQVSPTSFAVLLQQRIEGLEAILTVATWEKSVMSLQADLLGAYTFGVRHLICRTGIPPLFGDYPNAAGHWDVDSVELIRLLRSLNSGHDRYGISLAQPTAFVIGARINPSADNLAREADDARRKIEAGVDMLITPPVFDVDALEDLLAAARVPDSLPVLLGVMPLRDFDHAELLQNEVPGMVLPENVLERMWRAGERAPYEGQKIARELIERAKSSERIRGAVLTPSSNDIQELIDLNRAVLAK